MPRKGKQKQRFPKCNVSYRKRKQREGFLNRHDFAYARRDTVNQVGKITPNAIKNASGEIIIFLNSDVYQTPFRLLGDFCKKQLNKLKNTLVHVVL